MDSCIKKAHNDSPGDLISDLPRDVIDCILEHLPIRDAVRTSILSRKWRYMWITVQRLVFDDNFFASVASNRHFKISDIPDIITEILSLHDGPLHQFILSIPYVPTRIRCLSEWILILSRRSIKHLELVNQLGPNELPSHVFSCQHLTYLRLSNFTLTSLPDFVGFKSLIELHMDCIEFQSATLERLISSCPLLKVLTIVVCHGFDHLNISAPCLLVLHVKCVQCVQVKLICLEKSKIIERARAVEENERGRGSNLVNFFSSLPKIEKLCLIYCYIKFLSAGCVPLTLPNLIYSLKHLKLHGINFSEQGEISLLVCLLKSSPNLVELELKIYKPKWRRVLNSFEDLFCNSCSLDQLRIVNVEINTVFKPAMDLVKYLLANSPSLETLTFLISPETFARKHRGARKLLNVPRGARKLFRISRDLSELQRESPRARINFLHPFYYYYEL